jgi:hypothetical protein
MKRCLRPTGSTIHLDSKEDAHRTGFMLVAAMAEILWVANEWRHFFSRLFPDKFDISFFKKLNGT